MLKEKQPQYLHLPQQFLMFEQDELIVGAGSYCVAIFVGGYTWFLLLVATPAYMYIKRRHPRGFLNHLPYRLGVQDLPCYPNSFQTRFRG